MAHKKPPVNTSSDDVTIDTDEWLQTDPYEHVDGEYGDESDPTHRCLPCDTERYIESAPASEYTWCDDCESVTRHRRIEYDQ